MSIIVTTGRLGKRIPMHWTIWRRYALLATADSILPLTALMVAS
jgi:hypothetical protein